MKYELNYCKNFAANLLSRRTSLVNQIKNNPKEYSWLKPLVPVLTATADTIDELVDACMRGDLPQELEKQETEYVKLTQTLRAKALALKERAPWWVNNGKGGLLSVLLDKAADIIVSFENRAFAQLNPSEGDNSLVQAEPDPVTIPGPNPADTSLQAKYDELLKKYDDLKILWDMYGGEEGIMRAYQKADMLDKVVSKISEALAILPPKTEGGDKE